MIKQIIFLVLLLTSSALLSYADDGVAGQDKQGTKGKIQKVDVTPVPIKQVNPVYPDSARRTGIEGMVYLQVLVGEKGFVKEVKVMKNESGSELLENAAMKAALDWTFQPVMQNDTAVSVYVTLPFRFKLANEGTKK